MKNRIWSQSEDGPVHLNEKLAGKWKIFGEVYDVPQRLQQFSIPNRDSSLNTYTVRYIDHNKKNYSTLDPIDVNKKINYQTSY